MQKNIYNLFKLLILLFITLGYTYVYPKEDNKQKSNIVNINAYSDLHGYFRFEVQKLLMYYEETKPVKVELFNTEDPIVKSFLKEDLRNDATEPLAVMYYPKFKVDKEEAAFCMVYYDSKQNLFKTYEDMKNFTDVESIQYLTWHEMGHCLTRHHNYAPNNRKAEEIADTFAIAVALNNNNFLMAKKIVRQVTLTDKDDIHGNGAEIEKFYKEAIKYRFFITKRSINQIIDIVIYFNKNGSLEGFKFIEPLKRPLNTNLNYVEVRQGQVKKIDTIYKPKNNDSFVTIKKEDLIEKPNKEEVKIKLNQDNSKSKNIEVIKKTDNSYNLKKGESFVEPKFSKDDFAKIKLSEQPKDKNTINNIIRKSSDEYKLKKGQKYIAIDEKDNQDQDNSNKSQLDNNKTESRIEGKESKTPVLKFTTENKQ